MRWVPSFPQLWLHPQLPAQLLRPTHSKGSGFTRSLVLLSHLRGTAHGANPRPPVRSSAEQTLSIIMDSRRWAPAGFMSQPYHLGAL